MTDAAINISPDLMTKAAIVQNAVDLARLLGIDVPKVAALSAVEVVKPAIASTIDAACLSKMAQRGQIRDAVVDGPLAFDNAISKDAARIKRIDSPVAGEVDILLAPDLASGNILAKGSGIPGRRDHGRHRGRGAGSDRAAIAIRSAFSTSRVGGYSGARASPLEYRR